MRAATNIQPRRHLRPLVPEFKEVVTQDSSLALPPNSRALSTPKREYVASAKGVDEGQITVGIHFSPEEFVAKGASLGHPADHSSLFPKEVKATLDHIKKKSIHQLAIERTEEVKRWMSLISNTSEKEKEMKSSLSPRIFGVLESKRLFFLESLIKESGHEEVELVNDIRRGFDLTGALPRSGNGVFSQKFRPASMTCEDLRRVSSLGREAILNSLQSSGDHDIDVSLFEATMKEVNKGFIEGPIDKHSLPVGSTLTKRFPVKQKNKVRPIDDYKASLVNFAVTQTEGVTVHTIDYRPYSSIDRLVDAEWVLESA